MNVQSSPGMWTNTRTHSAVWSCLTYTHVCRFIPFFNTSPLRVSSSKSFYLPVKQKEKQHNWIFPTNSTTFFVVLIYQYPRRGSFKHIGIDILDSSSRSLYQDACYMHKKITAAESYCTRRSLHQKVAAPDDLCTRRSLNQKISVPEDRYTIRSLYQKISTPEDRSTRRSLHLKKKKIAATEGRRASRLLLPKDSLHSSAMYLLSDHSLLHIIGIL